MQQDDDQNGEQQTQENQADSAQVVALPTGKKGGKPPVEKPVQAQGGDVLNALKTQLGQSHSKLDALKKQVEQVGMTVINTERDVEKASDALAKSLKATAENVSVIGKLVKEIHDDLDELRKEHVSLRAELLSVVDKYARAGHTDRQAIVATCEALTGLRRRDAVAVRRLIAALRKNREREVVSTTPAPASRRPSWANAWTAAACVTAIGFGLAWILLG